MIDISIILPKISDKNKILPFCECVFSYGYDVEIIICECENINLDLISGINKLKIVENEEPYKIQKALQMSNGKFVVFSDVNATYSSDAFKIALENYEKGACIFNSTTDNGKLFRDNFSFDELGMSCIYSNHFLRNAIIKKYSLQPFGTSDFAIMNFLADYYRFDNFNLIDSAVVYCNCFDCSHLTKTDIQSVATYSQMISESDNFPVIFFYINNAFNFFYKNNATSIVLLKLVLHYFKDNYAVCSWIRNAYDIDVKDFLLQENPIIEKTDLHYKEIKMPMLASDMAEEFAMGKQGSATLKKCIIAYLNYNVYIKKGNKIAQLAFKILLKILGGGTNA